MIVDRAAIVRVGQAVDACYDPFFLDRPERVVLAGPHDVIWGTDRDGPRPYGVVFIDPVLQAWVIAIRGTDSIPEWIADATALLMDCPFLPGTRSHLGFTEVYETLAIDGMSIRTWFIAKDRPIIVAGHSLGAALATLTAVAIGGTDLVTFAGPAVGNDDFTLMAQTRLASSIRVVNKHDIVPQLPLRVFPDFLFSQIGLSMEIDLGGVVQGTPTCQHSLTNYLHALDATIQIDPQCLPA